MNDAEFIRAVMSDKQATPREKEAARRISRLLHAHDDLEAMLCDLYAQHGDLQEVSLH